ncbi:primosomal protein DnaI [Ammoniphilus sp. CFH 90114]|uniref:primosomal protein DnaI n=1 Tax=Ammoniphilus sp. CFH 90114 TaxID=2493665 RepID=UPI00100E763E|nr:primosomal protein DnaI [Ammoniphilus sp. CFH 90114]RXT04763.1 primosomal protein DnaI [Ammoniphilus sp. CFH 90114]
MEPISKTLSNIRWKQPLGIPSLDVIRDNILHHRLVVEFCENHQDVTEEMLDRSLVKLDQAILEHKNCQVCTELQACPNLVKGHQGKLTMALSYIDIVHVPCAKWNQHQEQKRRENLIKSHYIPKDVLAGSFQQFVQDPQRFEAFRALMEFCLKVEPGSKDRKMKGIYLYGPLGVGKSYLLAATARKLSTRGISSLMVYTPDFFREVKESLQDHSLQQKLETLKKVPILILDDIGAESLSPWARDEVLGAILQYRISENLPTLFSSNYDYSMLEEHLSHSAKGGMETMKAKRIMERIIHYTDAYFVSGINRRMQQNEGGDVYEY